MVSRLEEWRSAKKLIKAARDAADGGPPPVELSIAWNCNRWNCLPEAGGLLDQDWSLITRMNAAQNVYNVVSKLRNMKGAQIHALTDGDRRILRYLKDIGVLYD